MLGVEIRLFSGFVEKITSPAVWFVFAVAGSGWRTVAEKVMG